MNTDTNYFVSLSVSVFICVHLWFRRVCRFDVHSSLGLPRRAARRRPAGERLAELGGANSAKALPEVPPVDATLRLG